MHWNHEMMGWAGSFGMIFFWIILIVVVIILVRMFMIKTNGSPDHKETPLEILKRRYANGEINKEEYDEKRKDLKI